MKVHVGPAGGAAASLNESSAASAAPLETAAAQPTAGAPASGASSTAARRLTVDDRAFRIVSGRWTRRPFDGARGGTFTASRTRGATLVSPRLRGRSVELIARICPTCGAVEVVWGGRRVGTVSLRSPRTRRAVLPVAALAKPRAGRIRLRVTSTRRVAIDALMVS